MTREFRDNLTANGIVRLARPLRVRAGGEGGAVVCPPIRSPWRSDSYPLYPTFYHRDHVNRSVTILEEVANVTR